MRLFILIAAALLSNPLRADYREFRDLTIDPALESRIRLAVDTSLKEWPALKAEDLGITVVDLTKPATVSRADYNGNVPFYPASVIKLFHMADIFMQDKERLGDVGRALREMIVVSDNDATAYLVDILAGTCAGTELEGRALRRFTDQRRDINRHFEKLGYDISAMMKPWSFGPYGRELQLLGENRENRNRLTPNTTASLLTWIARRRVPHADEMMELLYRPLDPRRDDENQIDEFIGGALPAGSRLWSKAGWTSEVRHDAAYVELPNEKRYVVVIFTRGLAQEETLVTEIARNLFEELGR